MTCPRVTATHSTAWRASGLNSSRGVACPLRSSSSGTQATAPAGTSPQGSLVVNRTRPSIMPCGSARSGIGNRTTPAGVHSALSLPKKVLLRTTITARLPLASVIVNGTEPTADGSPRNTSVAALSGAPRFTCLTTKG